MPDIIIFAGTTEGRILSELLADSGVKIHVCVATEYGETLIKKNGNIEISHERLPAAGMIDLIKKKKAKVIVDATHPYAIVVSENIKKACSETGCEYIRLLRPEGTHSGNVVTVKNIDEAVQYLKGTTGNVLVATGSKELAKFTALDGYKERIFARVLSLPDVAVQCAELGFRGKNLICMQGPFNEEINYGMMKQFGIKHMVTKDSGEPGGFEDKMRAAVRACVNVILVGRPKETGLSYDDVVKELSKRFSIKMKRTKAKKKRTVWMIGAGMGYPDGMTIEAAEACRNADLIIGPKRMIDLAGAGKKTLEEFNHEKVIAFLRDNPEYENVAMVFSGDIGFYSGSKKIIENADPEWNIVPICGVSSVMYLCSKLGIPWQDAELMSSHGRGSNVIGAVRTHEKVFSLLSKGTDVNELCKKMVSYGMNDVAVTVGERLGYPDEKITTGKPKSMSSKKFDDLSVILIINGSPDTTFQISIPDEDFIRGDVPMTKSEVRTLTVGKMRLKDDSVIYDVGAGTGSVSIEMARAAVNGKVYAIEMEKDALELIQKNKVKFGTDNVEIIEGKAPGVLADLPAPTHAFIGGSGGSLLEIMKTIKEKNPDVTMIVNSVTMETAYDALKCIKELDLEEVETICVSISKAKTAGRSHLMVAQNPIYMTVCRGRGK